MKLDSKIYRKAAEIIYEGALMKNYLRNIRSRFSCSVILNFGDNKHVREYISLFGTNGHLYIESIEGEGLSFQSQLHRALMLDLIAELVENNDF